MHRRRYLAFIPLAALIAVFPLILHGPSCGHDFEFHLRNWLEVGSQWRQGVLLPQWDFTAAWNSGEPRFVFYPPISWTVGALLGFVLPWAAVPPVFIWMALTCCGLTMYRLACEWTSSGNALIAAAFYMGHPYMLFTFYERAAYAELLAAAWIPLLLLSILRPRLTLPGIALPICLLWLTNAPAAVIGCYTLAVLGLVRVLFSYRDAQGPKPHLREAAIIAAGCVLGIGCAAFYIVPATIEQHWVKISMPFIRGVRYQDNFLFGYIGDPSHDAILRTASLCAVALLALAAVCIAIAYFPRTATQPAVREGTRRRAVLALGLATCCIAFLLTSPSEILWRHVPELLFLQFPWRLCAVLGAISAALLALALHPVRLHAAAAVAISLGLTLALTLGGNRFFRQPCFPSFSVAGIVDSFSNGGRYDYTDEYPPVGADGEKLQHSNPSFWLAANPTDPAPQAAPTGYSVALGTRLHLTVATPVPSFVVLNLRDYPAWRITINGNPVGAQPHRDDGLIVLPIAGGISHIAITYGHTPDRIIGWAITLLSAVVLLLLPRRTQRGTLTASPTERLCSASGRTSPAP